MNSSVSRDVLFCILVLLAVLLSACSSCPPVIRKMAKSDIDLVADAHFRQVDRLLRDLTLKLYRRNPRELAKAPGATIKSRLLEIFSPLPMPPFAELGNRRGNDAIELCFDPDFTGDRAFALISGLRGMILTAYGNRGEQFLFDSLDPQALHHSARNLEIVTWRLSNRRNTDGEPFLLTNSLPGEERNLSFERLFGKLISLQEMMAGITAERQQRVINKVVQSIASSVLLPVGL